MQMTITAIDPMTPSHRWPWNIQRATSRVHGRLETARLFRLPAGSWGGCSVALSTFFTVSFGQRLTYVALHGEAACDDSSIHLHLSENDLPATGNCPSSFPAWSLG